MANDQFVLRIDSYLRLELLDRSHAEELFELTERNREFLREWLPWLDSNRYLQNTIDFIKYTQMQYKENIGLHLCIRFRDKIAGVIGFHRFDWLNHSADIGYWLGEGYQGKGIITKACSCLLDYAFGNFGLNRIEIRCAVGNSRSRAIPERLGFRVEGTIREAEWLYDHYVDHVVYGILRDEWRDSSQ